MGIFIKKIVLFCCLVVAVYTGLIVVAGEYGTVYFNRNLFYPIGGNGHNFSRLREVANYSDVDILFLGSSHAYRGFDTRIFRAQGWSVFNLGSSNQTPLQTSFILDKYLSQLSPDLVIYEVNPEIFSIDGVESTIDYLANVTDESDTWFLFSQNVHLRTMNTFVYANYRHLFNRNEGIVEKIVKKNGDKYVEGGFVEQKMATYKYNAKQKQVKWEFSRKQKKAFDTIIELLKQNKTPVLLIQAPVTTTRYSALENKNIFEQEMNRNELYWNTNGVVALDDSLHFYDGEHLNQLGVEIFNEAVVDYIDKRIKW